MANNGKRNLNGILVALIGVLIYSVFINVFSFSQYYAYRAIVFGFSIFNVVMLFIILVAEISSTKFDRTKNINTVYATLFLFLGYLTSYDIVLFLDFVGGVVVPEVVETILLIFHNIFILLMSLFFFRFFESCYQTKSYRKIHFIILPVFVIAHILLSVFHVFYGIFAVLVVEALYICAFNFHYFQVVKKRNNPLPGILSFIVVIALCVSMPLDMFYHFEHNFIGSNAMFNIIVSTSYIFIYVQFLLSRTNEAYQYEDKIKEEEFKKSHIMHVTCFQCFDCYYDDLHLIFPSKKAKEFFALMVILKGRSLTIDKAITYLWPDKDVDKAKVLYRNTIMKIRHYFKSINYNALTFRRGETLIDISSIKCDYYDILDGEKEYDGSPLMPEYDWSLEFENTLIK